MTFFQSVDRTDALLAGILSRVQLFKMGVMLIFVLLLFLCSCPMSSDSSSLTCSRALLYMCTVSGFGIFLLAYFLMFMLGFGVFSDFGIGTNRLYYFSAPVIFIDLYLAVQETLFYLSNKDQM